MGDDLQILYPPGGVGVHAGPADEERPFDWATAPFLLAAAAPAEANDRGDFDQQEGISPEDLPQQIVRSDVKMSIPESALLSYDIDALMSWGLDVEVEAAGHATADGSRRRYHAQIDCYQAVDAHGAHEAPRYILEHVDELRQTFQGYKVRGQPLSSFT